MDRLNYIVAGHAPEGQAITTRYFVKKQNELIQIELLRRFTNTNYKYKRGAYTVLSFVQL